MESKNKEFLKDLPSVDQLVEMICNMEESGGWSRKYIVKIARMEIDTMREAILSGSKKIPKQVKETVLNRALKTMAELKTPSLKRVVNLSGVFVHTNLGRAPLSRDAIDALETAAYYCNLEYDLSERKRGKRDRNMARMLSLIAGTSNFLLTNNNAAALFLILNTFGNRKKVAVSRGELIEIGGSFRIPDIMRASGAKLVEVGTTNRTRLSDYEKAADEGAVMFLKVHTSNYRIGGFTEEAEFKEMAELAKSRNILCVNDLGSGTFIDLGARGLPKEPTVQDSLNEGADLVSFSMDKLLGGPQGGLVLGRKDLIEKMNKNPIKRVIRAGKLTMLALDATLRGYLDEENFINSHPLYRNFEVTDKELDRRGEEFISKLKPVLGEMVDCAIKDDKCYLGGGSLPEQSIKTKVLELTPVKIKLGKLCDLFFDNDPPIIGRVSSEKLLLDLRQLENPDDAVPSGKL